MKRIFLGHLLAILIAAMSVAAGSAPTIEFKSDEARGQLQVLIGGQEALVYVFGKDVDLPHFFPLRSPSGKSMTVEQTEPYPHHRSFWFADTVQLAGQREVSFYNALYSGTGPTLYPVGTGTLGRVELGPGRVVLVPGDDAAEAVTLRCLKHRHGEPADIALRFDKPLQRFTPTDPTPAAADRGAMLGQLAALWNRTPAASDDDGGGA